MTTSFCTSTRQSYKLSLTVLSLFLCSFVAVATPAPQHDTTTTTTQSSSLSLAELKADENFLCPEDCRCVLAHHTHKPFLHAKCSSLKGLKAEGNLQATLPIHSIDLSYLNLTRLSHSLEKLHDLTSIDLSHNELHEIGHLGRRIKKLNLKHNRINSSKLTKLSQHVQTLNLQHNDITNLPLEFTKLSQLQSLELAHNEINCSCDTLEVRNWLQERHVFMEHPVKCFYPTLYKGKSWLQIKQSVVCEKEKRTDSHNIEETENELMMGDQPFEASGEELQDEEELGKDFMPIDTNTKKSVIDKSAPLTLMSDVEGSGDLSEMNLPLDMLDNSTSSASLVEVTTDLPEQAEDEEGSGSGGGLLIIPALQHEPVLTDDFDIPESKEEHADEHDDHDNDNKPIEEPEVSADIFHHSLGIFDGDENRKPSTEQSEVEEEEIKPVSVPTLGEGTDMATEGPEADAVAHAKMGKTKDDSNATYFLLGVIGLIVIGLLFYVAIKRCKHDSSRHDAENPQTELVDMDKKQLGKPLRNGVPEHVPLIGEKTKSDMAKPINGSKPYGNDSKDGPSSNEPLLNGNGQANGNGAAPAEEPETSRPNSQLQAPHEYYPISPRYPTPQSPRASKYSQQLQQAEPNNNDPTQAYLPSSPKSGRYSPVYSPETGRVKIKLSETPRPKTPMLVTRSRSNAGDIITTPISPIQATPVHTAATATTNGHAGRDH